MEKSFSRKALSNIVFSRDTSRHKPLQSGRATRMKMLVSVVTFKRRELLGRCIDQIQRQTRRADQMLIINNGSTDGTEAMLRDRNISFITQENGGSAGGWATGIQFALDM